MTSAVATAGRGEQWNATVATFAELRVLSAPVGAPYTAGRVVTTRGGACHFTDSLGDRVWTAHLSSPAVRVVMLEGGGASGAGGLAGSRVEEGEERPMGGGVTREVRIGVSAAEQDHHLEQEGSETAPDAELQLVAVTRAGPAGRPNIYARGGVLAAGQQRARGAPEAALVRYGAGGCSPGGPGFPHCVLGVHSVASPWGLDSDSARALSPGGLGEAGEVSAAVAVSQRAGPRGPDGATSWEPEGPAPPGIGGAEPRTPRDAGSSWVLATNGAAAAADASGPETSVQRPAGGFGVGAAAVLVVAAAGGLAALRRAGAAAAGGSVTAEEAAPAGARADARGAAPRDGAKRRSERTGGRAKASRGRAPAAAREAPDAAQAAAVRAAGGDGRGPGGQTTERRAGGEAAATGDGGAGADGERGRGLRVGRLEVRLDQLLGHGSHGTCVYRGALQGRPVAVKRMLREFGEVAAAEMALLLASDVHPNVVKYYGTEEDGVFVYIAVQLCAASLQQLCLRFDRQAAVADPPSLEGGSALRHASALQRPAPAGAAQLPALPAPAVVCAQLLDGLHFLHSIGLSPAAAPPPLPPPRGGGSRRQAADGRWNHSRRGGAGRGRHRAPRPQAAQRPRRRRRSPEPLLYTRSLPPPE